MKKEKSLHKSLCAFIVFLCGGMLMWSEGLAQEREILQVTVAEKEPFVFFDDGEYSGFAIDLWDAIAQKNNWDYEYKRASSLIELLRTQRNATADAAIGDVIITADRKEVMDFSEPTFDGGLQIVTYKKNSLRIFANALKTPELGFLAGVLAGALLLATHGLWLGERSRDKKKKGYVASIGGAFWEIVTLGGFGRLLPQSAMGRFSLLSWMFIATACLLLYVASVSSALTTVKISNAINTYHDIRTKNVGALKGSIALEFMRDKGMDAILYEDQKQMYEDVTLEIIDAAISDVEQVQHEISSGNQVLETAGDVFSERSYGVAVPIGSQLTLEINTALNELRKDGEYAEIYGKWFK